ncbi:TetR/AcrR family transcriptional regulator [Paenibacillus apiarius]|uniref:TetR/AcrR family transcriptional regulator n=1 Tax=Paenibacillus apiarius TaxID=46240 RepID=A0ABT4DWZ2_9BACL|nr:TetR/AcrR family transcriptional regulator [Paenibacillus apiarius]MCY9515405.1 TetR/AcrR family transcriptional regulator [Paenibacillus apiarius]MCY9521861.1 TetR/AcrR family transcriptional regulator [Paenibacillus apiarius]MCY9550254.1 TetR/AcrR family transcriptional regulator [Paenibacillus apiarius]MCY9559530.1 TetR/AcrR family transcriptional regulator [Paenibacillus apiarius]MCY9686852.1 TetR/AcrR family transcriptional regulator [Paenibacillus apiarius]
MSYGYGDKLHLILDAAYELFGSDGFYETKMSDIADKAGIAKGTLYLYFKSKEQLFTAMTVRDFEQYLRELEFGLNQRHSLEERLRFIADHHLRYYYNRKQYTNLFFKTPNNDPDMMAALRDFMQSYMRLISETMEAYGLPEPILHAKSYTGMLDMIKLDILFSPEFTERDLQQRIRFVADLFMNGCAANHAEVSRR